MSLKEELARIIAKKRVYASSDEEGPDVTDAQVELGIVKDLLESMECSGEAIYVDPVSGANPPDCIARGIGGERVAIEVTEFVCRTAVEINQKADRAAIARFEPDVMVARVWQRSDFLQHLERLLKTKDGKTYVGGPFARVVLLFHTDEPMLIRSQWENWLLGHRFGPFKQITEAYFLFPYECIGYRPYQRLSLYATKAHSSTLPST